jgi:dipeptide/tripeptide permease
MRSKLPREFWAVNASNLFERGAYYGMLAVFSYHLVYNVGIESWMVGILTGLSMGLINFLPLISTAIASKYGFKKILLFSYITLAIGYITLGFGYSLVLIFIAVIIMGLGSGFEKALIAASISHSSDENNRDYAFNVYYWVINIGAFLIPMSITFLFKPDNYGNVFFLMGFFVLSSFMIILTSYKNPVKPDRSLPVLDAVKNLKVIFKDRKFLLILLIFSGCWFMLFTRKPFTPLFMTDFGILPAWFIPILAALNPGTIILLGQVWAYYIKDKEIDSLKLLILGVFIISAGFLIVGITLNPVVFIAGIIILSFGELVSYPAFLSYVSKIPPKEDRSIYMGYSFIPLAIAGVIAPIAGGFLYYQVAEVMGMGRLFWAIIASFGLLTASAFIQFDRKFNKKEKKSTIPSYSPMLLIPVILIFASVLGPDTIYRDSLRGEDGSDENDWTYNNQTITFGGDLDETDSTIHNIPSQELSIESINVKLTWSDEDDIRRLRRYENSGDTFSMEMTMDDVAIDQKEFTNSHGDQGIIEMGFQPANKTYEASFEITLVECGNFNSVIGGGLLIIEDTSNTYQLEVTVSYREPLSE